MTTITIKWKRKMFGKYIPYETEIKIHPFNNGKIVINYPGAEGDIDGYENKYEKLSNYIVEKGLASVVRSGNPYIGGWDMTLRQMLHYTVTHSKEICGTKKPEVYLMGFSAGAGAISMIAWEYPEVSKILLLAPAIQVGEKAVANGLAQFKGEAYIIIGDEDEIVKPEAGQIAFDLCTNASHRELVKIKNCDHQFRGKENGKILSQTPFWAFSGNKPNFPSETIGISLYN